MAWFIGLSLFIWPRTLNEFNGPGTLTVQIKARPNYLNPAYYLSIGFLGAYNNAFIYAELSQNDKRVGAVILTEGGDLPEDHDLPELEWTLEGVYIKDEKTNEAVYIPYNEKISGF